jgi:hypothetical protein
MIRRKMNSNQRIAAECIETTLDGVEDILASRIKMWRNKPKLDVIDVITHTNRITELETVMGNIRTLRRSVRKVSNET